MPAHAWATAAVRAAAGSSAKHAWRVGQRGQPSTAAPGPGPRACHPTPQAAPSSEAAGVQGRAGPGRALCSWRRLTQARGQLPAVEEEGGEGEEAQQHHLRGAQSVAPAPRRRASAAAAAPCRQAGARARASRRAGPEPQPPAAAPPCSRRAHRQHHVDDLPAPEAADADLDGHLGHVVGGLLGARRGGRRCAAHGAGRERGGRGPWAPAGVASGWPPRAAPRPLRAPLGHAHPPACWWRRAGSRAAAPRRWWSGPADRPGGRAAPSGSE